MSTGFKTTLRSTPLRLVVSPGIGFLGVLGLLVSMSSTPAMAENRLVVESRTMGVGASGVPVRLLLSNDLAVLGYSLSIRVDGDVVRMNGFDLAGSDVEGADWSQGRLLEEGSWLVWGVALDISEPSLEDALPPAGEGHAYHIGSVTVDVVAGSESVTTMRFEDYLGSPPDPPAVNRLVAPSGEPLEFKAVPGVISVGRGFVRGDINEDGLVDVSDPITLLNFLFVGGLTIPCHDAADTDDSGKLEITDAIRLLGFLFGGGLRPQPPFPNVGIDETSDSLPECDPVPDAAGR